MEFILYLQRIKIQLNLLKLIRISFLIFCFSLRATGQSVSIEWAKCYGGSQVESAQSIIQTSDSGFIFGGYTGSNDGDVSGFHVAPYSDFWVAKIDKVGNLMWQKCFGGFSEDRLGNIELLANDSFIIAGSTASNDGDVSGSHGTNDYWVLKCDSLGDIIWKKCYGGSGPDEEPRIFLNYQQEYLLTGFSLSTDNDVFGSHLDSTCSCSDVWNLKLDT